MKIKPQPSLILWVFISIFLVFWLSFDLWAGVFDKEIRDLRTDNRLIFDNSPIWFSFVFLFKLLALTACLYFLYGVAQIARVMFKKSRKNKACQKKNMASK